MAGVQTSQATRNVPRAPNTKHSMRACGDKFDHVGADDIPDLRRLWNGTGVEEFSAPVNSLPRRDSEFFYRPRPSGVSLVAKAAEKKRL